MFLKVSVTQIGHINTVLIMCIDSFCTTVAMQHVARKAQKITVAWLLHAHVITRYVCDIASVRV